MKQVTSLPLNAKVLTEEQKTILLNTALQTLHWISPLLNPNLGQVEPPAEYKRDGLLAYADGTNWNPISGGEGYYRYDVATTAWVKVEGSGGGSGDMLKSTYDPNTDGVIALAQLDATVSTFKQTNHDALPNPHHANTNDPSADQKAALAGTSGTPSITNKYVTNDDSRNSDARTPTAHNQDASTINAGTLDGDRLPALSASKKGAVPATGTPSGKYLKDDGTFDTPTAVVADESITNAKLAHIATSIIKGRVTAATGDVEDLTAVNVRTIINVEDGATKYPDTGEQAFLDADHTKLDGIAAGANAYVHPNHSGDVTSVADGAQTIANSAVTNAKMADMVQKTYKGRTTASTGAPEDVSVATLKADLALAKADVGLGNCDNTSDANKPVSTAGQTALDLKANVIYVMHCQHQKTAPADCGSSVAGIQTRVLNTVVLNEITGASLASNQITLPAGTYEVYAFCPTYAIGTTQAGIYNVTDSAYLLMGTNGYDITGAFVQGKFTLAAEKVIGLRHFTQTARAGNGLGVSANSGIGKEVFANIMIWKV